MPLTVIPSVLFIANVFLYTASVQVSNVVPVSPLVAASINTTESWFTTGRDLLLHVQHGRH